MSPVLDPTFRLHRRPRRAWGAVGIAAVILARSAAAQELAHATLDPAGGRGSGSSGGQVITNDASLGGIGGEAHDTAELTVRPGFAGQLWDATGLEITPQPAALAEQGSLALTARATGDDGTSGPLDSGAVRWGEESPFVTISAAGLVSAGLFPGNQSATITASYGDLKGSALIDLYDSAPDDFGPFAGDGLDDGWQWRWFADNPADGGSDADPDGDGQINALESLAGTHPLDASSRLRTRIEGVEGAANSRRLVLEPWNPGRTYTWESSTDLRNPWTEIVGDPVAPQPNGEAHATDDFATELLKFYRLRIE